MYYLFLPHEWTSIGPARVSWLVLFSLVILGAWGMGTVLFVSPLLAIYLLLILPGLDGVAVFVVSLTRRHRPRRARQDSRDYQEFVAFTLPPRAITPSVRVRVATRQRSLIYDN